MFNTKNNNHDILSFKNIPIFFHRLFFQKKKSSFIYFHAIQYFCWGKLYIVTITSPHMNKSSQKYKDFIINQSPWMDKVVFTCQRWCNLIWIRNWIKNYANFNYKSCFTRPSFLQNNLDTSMCSMNIYARLFTFLIYWLYSWQHYLSIG
jgi:uncharacterized membrane protein